MTTYSAISEKGSVHAEGAPHSAFPIINAVTAGLQQGLVFRNQKNDYWVLHKAGFSEAFLKGETCDELVDFFVENKTLPQYFHIYDPAKSLVKALEARSDVFSIRKRDRIKLTYDTSRSENGMLNELSSEFLAQEVTNDNFDSLSVFNLDLSKKFWNGKNDFVTNALGVCMMDQQNIPMSVCYAAAVADKIAEIDVVTSENQRGKGLAKAIVASFVSKCLDVGIVPNWDCFTDNIFSLKTALRLGFNERKSYEFISVYRK